MQLVIYFIQVDSTGVPRQNYDLPRNQSDRSVAGFAFPSMSNWLHAPVTEAPVCSGYTLLCFSPRSAVGESCSAATARCIEIAAAADQL
jgi:hypothetical protein